MMVRSLFHSWSSFWAAIVKRKDRTPCSLSFGICRHTRLHASPFYSHISFYFLFSISISISISLSLCLPRNPSFSPIFLSCSHNSNRSLRSAGLSYHQNSPEQFINQQSGTPPIQLTEFSMLPSLSPATQTPVDTWPCTLLHHPHDGDAAVQL